jgi:hypothetical protein
MDGQGDTTKLVVANALRNAKIGDILLPLVPKGKNTQQDILQLINTFRCACPELMYSNWYELDSLTS